MLGGGFGLSDRSDRHSFAFERAVFARKDENRYVMTRDSTHRRDKDNLLGVGGRQETVYLVSITICLVSGRDGCHSASLYIAYFSQFFSVSYLSI
jgi:hypothetical protein